MASAHRRSGVRGLPPPNRWVFRCLGSKRCSSAHKASEIQKPVVTLFTGARLRRLLLCAMRSLYQIRVIRIGTYHFPGMTSNVIQQEIETDKTYFASRGVTKEFLNKAFSVESTTLWFPTVQELIDNGVITHMYDGTKFIAHNK